MNQAYLEDYEKKKLLFLAKRYDCVIGDEFQLFYRGVVKSMNPYKYYIYVECVKGRPYPRYFTYTPKAGEEGSYQLKITLFDDFMNVIDSGETTLVVHKIEKPKKKLNVLCIGDSLTCNGVWPATGCQRFEDTKCEEGKPICYGLGECFEFVGTCKREVEYETPIDPEKGKKIIGFEGYGGWQWRHFVLDETIDPNCSVWVEYKNNPFTEHDQHSTWECDGKKWVLETFEPNRLKFKRGIGNWGISNTMGKVFKHVDGGIHTDDFTITGFEYEKGNPFLDKENGGISIKNYVQKHGFESVDLAYIFLSWNGMWKPYNHDYSMHEEYIRKLVGQIHEDYPNALIRFIGIQSPSIDGGMASTYGANGYYSDLFAEICSAYYYDHYLEELSESKEYKDFCRYIDLKAQFDTEYNYPKMERKVNVRNPKTEFIGSNGLHPTMMGYEQFGDCFFRALVADVKEFNETK